MNTIILAFRITVSFLVLFTVLGTNQNVSLHAEATARKTIPPFALDPFGKPASVLRFPQGRKSVRIPMYQKGDHYFIKEMTIEGEKVGPVLVDTGAQISAIHSRLAAQLQLPSILSVKVNSPLGGSTASTRIHALDHADMHGVTLQNHYILSLDFSALLKEIGTPVQVILGGDWFGKAPFTFDPGDRSLTFHDPAHFKAPKGGYPITLSSHRLPDFLKRGNPCLGSPLLKSRINNTIDFIGTVDTGSIGSLGLGASYADMHPELIDPGRLRLTRQTLGGYENVWRARIQAFSFLGRQLNNLKYATIQQRPERGTHRQNELHLIGLALLDRYRLTFDYRARRVWDETRNKPPVKSQTLFHMIDREDLAGVTSWIGLKKDIQKPDHRGRTPLIAACMAGQDKIVTRLLEAGADVNYQDKKGWSALLTAATSNQTLIVKQLVKARAKINHLNEHGRSALWFAASLGNLQMVDTLLDAGASPEIGTPPPLFAAAKYNHPQIVRRLCERGASTEAVLAAGTPGHRRSAGYTPIFLAATAGFETFQVLLEAGADVKHKADDGTCVLHHAVMAKDARASSLLLKGAYKGNADPTDIYRETPLHFVARRGNPESIALLLKAGADINRKNAGGLKPIGAAASAGHLKAVKALISGGCDLSIEPGERYSLSSLFIAASFGNGEVVEALINAGARADLILSQKMSAIHVAAAGGSELGLKAILKAVPDANLNALDQRGMTPLMWAARYGKAQIVPILVDAGADVNMTDKANTTAMLYAAVNEHPATIDALVKRQGKLDHSNPDGMTPLLATIKMNKQVGAYALLRLGANPNHGTIDRLMPLHVAAKSGNVPMVRLLLKAGADPNRSSKELKMTPLLWAAVEGKTQVIVRLLEAGADRTAQNTYGMSAIALARQKNHLDAVSILEAQAK